MPLTWNFVEEWTLLIAIFSYAHLVERMGLPCFAMIGSV